MKREIIVKTTAKKGDKVIIADNQNTAGLFESRVYIKTKDGLIAGRSNAEHKTLAGAQKWAKRII